jgi:hypothetical protein
VAHKRRKPATVISGHGLRGVDQVCRPIASESAISPLDIQDRAVADRFRIRIGVACAVFALAFDEAALIAKFAVEVLDD